MVYEERAYKWEVSSVPEGMAAIDEREVSIDGHKHLVHRFHLDLHPVTNEQFAQYLQQTNEIPPTDWLGSAPPADKLEHPVVGVTLDQARRYAAWRKARLPTSLEWLAALRGQEGRTFPWGNDFDEARCHTNKPATNTLPIDSHPAGATPEGVHDLVGNVWEWVEHDPRGPSVKENYNLVFGCSYKHPCRSPEDLQTSVSEFSSYQYLGFRCAQDS